MRFSSACLLTVGLLAAACGDTPDEEAVVVPPTTSPTTAPDVERPASAPAAAAQAGATLGPAFSASIDTVTSADLPSSWRAGCPVGPESLRRVTVSTIGFDGMTRPGVVIVHADHAQAIVDVFSRLFAAGSPIERMEPVDVYGGSDDASMAANNTSAFNCRRVTGGTRYSEHSYGWAIDINPVQNPYVNGSTVLPPAGRDHLDRTPAPGRITANDAVVQAFAGIGWSWGGYWTSLKDYQHFSATNR